MHLVIVPGPGNGKELMDSLFRTEGAKVTLAHDAKDIAGADLIVTPRGPSRSFSEWYQEHEMGRTLLEAHQQGVPWIALCGSAIPLCAKLGSECAGVTAQSIFAATADNNRFFGQDLVQLADGTELPFHFTSAPSFEAHSGTEQLGTTKGVGSILRAGELVVASGLPQSVAGWTYLIEAAGVPIRGARVELE